MTRPVLAIWPVAGRWRVRQYLAPHGGSMGAPQLRYAVIDPGGRHVGSSASWSAAQAAAQELARGYLDALGRTTGR